MLGFIYLAFLTKEHNPPPPPNEIYTPENSFMMAELRKTVHIHVFHTVDKKLLKIFVLQFSFTKHISQLMCHLHQNLCIIFINKFANK